MKANPQKGWVAFLILLAVLILSRGFEHAAPAARKPAQSLPPGVERATAIDFEDDIIEGMNKNPFDSLTRVGKQDGGAHGRLYRRKQGFRREIKQTVREMGFAP